MSAAESEERGTAAAVEQPPLPVRLVGRTLSSLIAYAPFLWPVLRRPTERFWEKMAGGWDERVRPTSSDHLAPLMAACDHVGEPERILELGTGTGAGALMLADRFLQAEIWAADLSPAMIEQAQLKVRRELESRVHLMVADAASLPFPDGRFDFICQLNLPLFPDEPARLLAPGRSRSRGELLWTPHALLHARERRAPAL